ncbi:MAG TPA: ABC transporter ATP-binding protein [Gemmatimonadaceae bacterium]|nr:ABC transporter ATP-binding protein [Gemmatimonadaceae bacterium]
MALFRSNKPDPVPADDACTGPLVSMRGVEKAYDLPMGKSYVLRRITLDIQPGEFVTIMGPSGAGKSTLLSILGMFDGAWTGEFFFRHAAVHALGNKERLTLNRRHIGFVFQQYHLLDDLTVAENLDIPLSYRDVPRDRRAAIVADTLDRFQIVGKKDLYPRQLSGGQQQLVGVARAVIASPALLLADEPTGNLHSSQARDIMELFVALNRAGTTIVQVTHSEETARYGSRIVTGRDGWVVAEERPGGRDDEQTSAP